MCSKKLLRHLQKLETRNQIAACFAFSENLIDAINLIENIIDYKVAAAIYTQGNSYGYRVFFMNNGKLDLNLSVLIYGKMIDKFNKHSLKYKGESYKASEDININIDRQYADGAIQMNMIQWKGNIGSQILKESLSKVLTAHGGWKIKTLADID